jgi:hypothetical protein
MDPYSAPHLPRSVLLALWLGAGTGSERDREAALRVVQGDDEPHAVTAHDEVADDAGDRPQDLSALVRSWVDGAGSPAAVAALLPAPGDLAGAPAEVSTDAVAAGECLVVVAGPPRRQVISAAVPDVRRFGSVFEPGHEVTWHVRPVAPWTTRVLGTIGTVEEADRDLRTALAMAVRSLDALDVSHWRDDAADAIAALREPVDLAAVVPPGLDPRRVRLLSQALRLGAIARLGREDDGAAVNVFQSDQRSAALAAVDRAARRAISAATLHLP